MCKQISTPEFSVISTWLKCTLYLDKFSAISLVFFSRRNKGIFVSTSLSSVGTVRCRCNLRCYQWRWGCRLNKIFTPNYTEIFTSLKCTWYFVHLFCFAWISSIPNIIIVLFHYSHWKKGVVDLTAISSLVALWFDKLWCHRCGCQLDDLLFFGARLTWYSQLILLWYLHHWNVYDTY